MTRYRSRKFILAMGVVISASVLAWFGRIDAGVYSAVVIAVVGGYLTANVAQKKLVDAPVVLGIVNGETP